MPTTSDQDIAAGKQKQQSQMIPEKWRITADFLPSEETLDVQNRHTHLECFTAEGIAITESTASEIVQKISWGEWKAQIFMEAICKWASVAQQLVNCVAEIFFD